jgi:indole-3-glycerol phosphate synthase
MPDLLRTIVAATERIVATRREATPLDELQRLAERRTPRADRFRDALAAPDRISVIAECKRRSPSRGVLCRNYDPATVAQSYERGGAMALSVLTEPTFFDGALDHLAAVRAAVSLPLLRKDFIVDSYQLLEARANGADAILLIVAALSDAALERLAREARGLGLAALVEVHDADEVGRALAAGAEIIGVNNRNLRTLEVDVRASELAAARIPAEVIAVSESGLRTAADIDRLQRLGYRAFLIGERFMTEPDPGVALHELLRTADRRIAHGEGRARP